MNGHISSPLLPEKLKLLLNARAPENNLAAAIADVGVLCNGGEAEIASSWLTVNEQEEFKRYSFKKRRTEWLSGRICAKQAVLDLLRGTSDADDFRPLDITIAINPSGRPFFTINKEGRSTPQLDLSISHSNGKAVGIAGHGLCGVDIQHLNDTLFKVKDRYCNEIESAILDTLGVEERAQLGMLWVAKEAIRKSLSDIKLVGFLEMQLERITMEQGYHELHFQLEEPLLSVGTISATTHVHESFALAVCTVNRARLNA